MIRFKNLMVAVLACTALAATVQALELRLDDGTIIHGDVIAENDSVVTVRTLNLGDLEIRRKRIVGGLEGGTAASPRFVRTEDPAGYALFFLPTAFTPEAGSATFRDFELFFLNLGYSPTSTTVLSAGALFPITTEFQLLTFGFKQQVARFGDAAAAVTGNITVPVAEDTEGALLNGSAIVSWRSRSELYADAFGVHAALGYWTSTESDEGRPALGAGFEVRLSSRAKFIGEIYSPFLEDDLSMLNLGFRLHGDRLSADIAGIRPLEAEGDFLFFPLLIINYRF